jgi:hypothetical protein
MKRVFLLLFIATIVFSSCKNDLKLNAPYKEIPSIYAVLSPQENVHIIRVNKVFLGEGDANAMAKVADSVNYPAGELTITLDRYESGTNYSKQINAAPQETNPAKRKTITFHDSIIQADAGSFSSTQRVYVAYEDLHEGPPFRPSTSGGIEANPNWKVSGDYILTVKNNRTGNIFKARSTIVDSVRQSSYRPFTGYPVYPYPAGWSVLEDFVDYSTTEKSYSVKFTPNDASIYQLVVRFNFKENIGTGEVYRSAEYVGSNLDAVRDRKTSPLGAYLSTDFLGKDIFNAVGVSMAHQGLTDQVASRKMYMVEFLVYSSTKDYADYMEFVKPSLSISQSKPLYSNFDNRDALGIFTFRTRSRLAKEMSNSFINAFSDNPSTCQYKFVTVDDQQRGCK